MAATRPRQSRGADGRIRGVCVNTRAPLDQPDRDPDHLAHKERLGHGRGLQVEQVGIESEEGERQRRGRGREPAPRQPIEARASGDIGQRRGNRCRRFRWPTSYKPAQTAASAECGSGSHTEPSSEKRGRCAIEDPARNVQVRHGVAVVEHARRCASSTQWPPARPPRSRRAPPSHSRERGCWRGVGKLQSRCVNSRKTLEARVDLLRASAAATARCQSARTAKEPITLP